MEELKLREYTFKPDVRQSQEVVPAAGGVGMGSYLQQQLPTRGLTEKGESTARRPFNKFLRDIAFWEKERNDERKRRVIEQEYIEEDYSFSPHISVNSLKIFNVILYIYIYIENAD